MSDHSNLRKKALNLIKSGVWHTTSSERFDQILADGVVKLYPDILDSERWKANGGPENHSFVRKVGGVSLFDFRHFDEEEYSTRCRMSSWHEFVPICTKWESAVWIEIDTQKLGNSFIDGATLLKRWKDEEAYRHSIMPYIEACSLIDIPTSAFIRNVTLHRSAD